MDRTKKILAILGAIATIIGAVLGSGASFENIGNTNTEINTSDDDVTINEGDTIIGGIKSEIKNAGKELACELEPELCD
jgi:hypothetical protein